MLIVSAARSLTYVWMTSIQNGGYFWLKTNYRVYIFPVSSFYRELTIPAFFLGISASEKSIKVAEIACSTSQIRRRSRSSLSRRLSKFHPSRNDQANFLSLKIPLERLTDVTKVVNRNRRPRKLFVFFLWLLAEC